VFTRILSLRQEVSAAARYGLLVLYNLAYVVPLALIVIVYAATLHRISLTERGARVLKGVSGALLIGFGTLFVASPETLQ
jgi:cytochrome c biogenesis protein CcdA